jgi:two-component system nitrate/nitrite sensor histidine kinase NarX
MFAGEIPEKAKPIVLGIIQGVIKSGSPLILGNVTVEPGAIQEIKAIMAAPCISNQQRPIGGLLVGNIRQRNFGTRQMALLQMVANQVSLIVQNSELMADLAFNTMMGERFRLAREIHDGLAQTIGFLKLQVAQMRNYLERSDFVKLRQSLDVTYTTLSDTYLDARQAIDGLRINPEVVNMFCWLQQISQEFGEISGLSVELVNCDNQVVFAPEIQAQLIRIVQEALNNIRKHSHARKVIIRCLVIEDDFWLEVQDDGIGFSPDDISEPSQHGLIGMKERAELLGADFQIISQPNQGTIIRLQLSLRGKNTVSANE